MCNKSTKGLASHWLSYVETVDKVGNVNSVKHRSHGKLSLLKLKTCFTKQNNVNGTYRLQTRE